MDEKLRLLCEQIFGAKRLEIWQLLCDRADENGFVLIKIEELMQECSVSKPTAINALKFLQEKKILKKLKNGFYELKLGQKNEA